MDYNQAIESICFKFGYAVTEYEVFRWLRNFDENEWVYALNVLDKVAYYSSDRIDETLEYWIKKLIETYKDKSISILPSGSVGKSGNVMAYHAKKVLETIHLSKTKPSLLRLDDIKSVSEGSVLVLLDDFSGTGTSIAEFYKNNVKCQTENKNLIYCALTVAYMDKAKEFLMKECGIIIYGDVYKPAFIRRGSIVGYERNMIPIRNFCFIKGKNLMSTKKNKNYKPLGYDNSQSLICFEHTTPNNSLPILWFEGIIPGTSTKWNAIFPRFAKSRIDRGRRLRLCANFWLSAMQKMNLNNIDWSLHHTTDSLRLISLVAQKYHHKSDFYIAQTLGLSISDLEEITKLGKDKGLIDEQGGLTSKAKSIYEEIRKKDKILENDIRQQMSNINTESVYVPKSFRGLS